MTGGLEYELARDLAQRFGLKSVRVTIVHFHRVVTGQLGGADLAQLRTAGYAVGLDTDPALLVHTSLADGIINIVAVQEPSLVLVGRRSASVPLALGSSGEAIAASITTPVATRAGNA